MATVGSIEEIRRRQEEWMDAVRRKDLSTLEETLAEDYVLISARLGFVDRRAWLAAVADYDVEEFAYEESDIRVYGDVAVSNSHYRQVASYAGQDLTLPFYVTDVWVRRDGRWRVVTRHSSIVPTPPPE